MNKSVSCSFFREYAGNLGYFHKKEYSITYFQELFSTLKEELKPHFTGEKILDKLKNVRITDDYESYIQQFKRLVVRIVSSDAVKKQWLLKGLP
jgi:hypothetical protein